MRSLWTVFLALALAACATTDTVETQPPASVEDRAPGAARPAPGTQAVPPKPVTGVDLTGDRPAPSFTDPLRDPASPLSQRSSVVQASPSRQSASASQQPGTGSFTQPPGRHWSTVQAPPSSQIASSVQ